MCDVTTPRVSVIMAVFNAERYLRSALDSILGQTFGDLELLVVDDGSTDATPQILGAARDSRMRVLRQENAGPAAARNRAAAAARGEYLAVMDADDVSLPRRLEQQVAFLDAHPGVGVLGTAYDRIDERGEVSRTIVGLTEDQDLQRMLFIRCPFIHGSVMMRRSLFVEVGGYADMFDEDYELWTRLFGRTRFASTTEVLFRYRVHDSGISQRSSARRSPASQAITDALWRRASVPTYGVWDVVRLARPYKARGGWVGEELRKHYALDQIRISLELRRRGRAVAAARNLAGLGLSRVIPVLEMVSLLRFVVARDRAQ